MLLPIIIIIFRVKTLLRFNATLVEFNLKIILIIIVDLVRRYNYNIFTRFNRYNQLY